MITSWVRWVQSTFPHPIYLQAFWNLFSFISPTPQRRFLLEKLLVFLLIKKFLACCRTPIFIAIWTTVWPMLVYKTLLLYSITDCVPLPSVWLLAAGWTVWRSNPGRGEIFRTHPDRLRSPLSLKRPRRDGDHPPPSSAEVKEREELYLHSSSGPSWPNKEWNFP